MKKIVPSIMCADTLNLKKELTQLHEAQINWLHCDVMDGIFVNNLAMSPYSIKPIIDLNCFTIDIHLACIEPEKYVNMFAPIHPNYITFHIETCSNPEKIINQIHGFGIKAGVALNPETQIETVDSLLEKIDLILIMTVNPGFAGQVFQDRVINKIKSLDVKLAEIKKRPLIQVDGNIYDKTVRKITNYGIDLFVIGTSALFNQQKGSYQDKIGYLQSIIEQTNR